MTATTRFNQPPGPWNQATVTLFHGTLESQLASLRAGIDLRRVQRRSDFGPGFYTTTSERQALSWARRNQRRADGSPAVIRFELPRERLARLGCLWFVRADSDAEDYWSFVRHCRAGGAHRPAVRFPWYDLIAGPVSIDWEQRRTLPSSDQVSFHTPVAVAVLQAGMIGSATWP